MTTDLNCDGARGCDAAVTYTDAKGWLYCENHAVRLKAAGRVGVRKLRKRDWKRILASAVLVGLLSACSSGGAFSEGPAVDGGMADAGELAGDAGASHASGGGNLTGDSGAFSVGPDREPESPSFSGEQDGTAATDDPPGSADDPPGTANDQTGTLEGSSPDHGPGAVDGGPPLGDAGEGGEGGAQESEPEAQPEPPQAPECAEWAMVRCCDERQGVAISCQPGAECVCVGPNVAITAQHSACRFGVPARFECSEWQR